MTKTATDRIERTIQLRAPRARVWKALTDAQEFGTWFRVEFDGPFVAGKSLKGRVTYPGYEHVTFEMRVERIEPESRFAFRWHPYAVDMKADYSREPMTSVEFQLEEAQGGTRLTLVESGFDRIPSHRRDEAFRMNSGGWDEQMKNIARHVGV